MSVVKFTVGTTLTAPAVGGAGYIAYEQLTKEEITTPTVTDNAEDKGTTLDKSESTDVPAVAQDQTGETLKPTTPKDPKPASSSYTYFNF